MDLSGFITIGENIHCSRLYKRGGIHTVELPGGAEGIAFTFDGSDRVLAIPAGWGDISPAYNDGKVKHTAVAIYQATQGSADDRQAAEDFLCWSAQRQIDAAATFLDVNVDEYTNDATQRGETMQWLAAFLSDRFETPLSIDSSDAAAMAAGLKACRTDGPAPMVNSVSLERVEIIDVIKQFGASAVVSAAGRDTMPSTAEERMANFTEIVGLLDDAGLDRSKIHLDPLVFPISTDPAHGANFLQTVRQAREQLAGVHITGGLSNVSFGMPQRKLLNMVFMWLCVDAGADGGIIDPCLMSPQAVGEMDTEAESFKLARNFITGADMFGMEFIAAHREGRFG